MATWIDNHLFYIPDITFINVVQFKKKNDINRQVNYLYAITNYPLYRHEVLTVFT